uniref:RAP domain-containing protein n=1 Tax=Chromera velia CCMP2878 TaxID=1169474 RepID=A0A0G4FI70_9ALVE|eukprot:Cvel_17077.t1-p1 / transcript=Cvel_17077.t1 / gene=Cvel_17077 / organism=Chromera_velia_CCMP2878 / gene_product=hypothetical protein / transcript_product=hypothetical protein / location=Cvel_scaffold1346:40457-45794(+) / protein_length=1088 / sequence_SO=supercontig / SO=protein_coding / is_pseudo=false
MLRVKNCELCRRHPTSLCAVLKRHSRHGYGWSSQVWRRSFSAVLPDPRLRLRPRSRLPCPGSERTVDICSREAGLRLPPSRRSTGTRESKQNQIHRCLSGSDLLNVLGGRSEVAELNFHECLEAILKAHKYVLQPGDSRKHDLRSEGTLLHLLGDVSERMEGMLMEEVGRSGAGRERGTRRGERIGGSQLVALAWSLVQSGAHRSTVRGQKEGKRLDRLLSLLLGGEGGGDNFEEGCRMLWEVRIPSLPSRALARLIWTAANGPIEDPLIWRRLVGRLGDLWRDHAAFPGSSSGVGGRGKVALGGSSVRLQDLRVDCSTASSSSSFADEERRNAQGRQEQTEMSRQEAALALRGLAIQMERMRWNTEAVDVSSQRASLETHANPMFSRHFFRHLFSGLKRLTEILVLARGSRESAGKSISGGAWALSSASLSLSSLSRSAKALSSPEMASMLARHARKFEGVAEDAVFRLAEEAASLLLEDVEKRSLSRGKTGAWRKFSLLDFSALLNLLRAAGTMKVVLPSLAAALSIALEGLLLNDMGEERVGGHRINCFNQLKDNELATLLWGLTEIRVQPLRPGESLHSSLLEDVSRRVEDWGQKERAALLGRGERAHGLDALASIFRSLAMLRLLERENEDGGEIVGDERHSRAVLSVRKSVENLFGETGVSRTLWLSPPSHKSSCPSSVTPFSLTREVEERNVSPLLDSFLLLEGVGWKNDVCRLLWAFSVCGLVRDASGGIFRACLGVERYRRALLGDARRGHSDCDVIARERQVFVAALCWHIERKKGNREEEEGNIGPLWLSALRGRVCRQKVVTSQPGFGGGHQQEEEEGEREGLWRHDSVGPRLSSQMKVGHMSLACEASGRDGETGQIDVSESSSTHRAVAGLLWGELGEKCLMEWRSPKGLSVDIKIQGEPIVVEVAGPVHFFRQCTSTQAVVETQGADEEASPSAKVKGKAAGTCLLSETETEKHTERWLCPFALPVSVVQAPFRARESSACGVSEESSQSSLSRNLPPLIDAGGSSFVSIPGGGTPTANGQQRLKEELLQNEGFCVVRVPWFVLVCQTRENQVLLLKNCLSEARAALCNSFVR